MIDTPSASAQLLMRQAAADRIGISFMKLERLRIAGHIPEAVQVGRYHVFPVDQIDAIRARLVANGLIRGPRA